MSVWLKPSAEDQIHFLQNIQHLFEEGEFAATYKFALLLSLAELAVEQGDDSGAPLDLPMHMLGEKFVELYWRQIAPYQSGQVQTVSGVLFQNLGAQAAVIGRISKIYALTSGQLSKAKRHTNEWRNLINSVSSIIRNMPLRYLQIFGGQQQAFLYEYPAHLGKITLKSGVAFNFRRYQSLIQQFSRAGWIDHIRSNRRNHSMLGERGDLEAFMFGSSRASLVDLTSVLAQIQSGKCFYCEGRISARPEVDHFIPWSRYPRDTAHNFVLAHQSCNNNKREMLAAKQHLDKWLMRLDHHGEEIGGRLSEKGFWADPTSSKRIAHWAYQQAVQSNGIGWIAKGETEPLQQNILSLFVSADSPVRSPLE